MSRIAALTALLLATAVVHAAPFRASTGPRFAPVDRCEATGLVDLDSFRDPDCVQQCWGAYDRCMDDCWFRYYDNALCDRRFCNPPRERCDAACPIVEPSRDLTPILH